jgi:ABC-type antimicrobial peptide transport system permease subunit
MGWKLDEWEQYNDQDRQNYALDLYCNYLRSGKTISDDKIDIMSQAYGAFFEIAGNEMLSGLDAVTMKITTYGKTEQVMRKEYKIVGFFGGDNNMDLVICDSLYALHEEHCASEGYGKEVIAAHAPGIYAFAIAPMPEDADQIRRLVELNYNEGEDLRFSLQNQVMDTLGNFNEFIEIGAKVFLYIGLGFALFSALMLMNFISVSISYKRREIGILRAVGARSSDVFKIFFCEAFIIALINFILAVAAAIAATTVFNTVVRNEGLNVTLLNFGARQVILMFVITVAVAAIASFLPVWNIARRKPIDAIKNK